ncbi:MAG TPA: hypothetical protein VEL76_24585 [Gemmataceae bacterium]|nr:hypothetical protein [Gemmataceae bacterium]
MRDVHIQNFKTALGVSPSGILPESGVWTGVVSLGPSDLYIVEASETGTDRLVGRVKTASGSQPEISDLARSSGGVLYGVSLDYPSLDKLYTINAATGAAVEVGSLGLSGASQEGWQRRGAATDPEAAFRSRPEGNWQARDTLP